MNWQEEVAEHLMWIGFQRGQANFCIYHNPGRQVTTLVHGDDNAPTGVKDDLEWLKEELERKFKIKTTIIGHGRGEET